MGFKTLPLLGHLQNLLLPLYFLGNVSLINDFGFFYRDESGTCMCGENDNNTKSFRIDEGLWCCKSSQNNCNITRTINKTPEIEHSSETPLDAKCHGKVLTLEEQCNVEGNPVCHHYPSDSLRNLFAPRSFLNLCQDNRYVFHI